MIIKSSLFTDFIQEESLSVEVADKFNSYLQELRIWNENINLTAMAEEYDVLMYHFRDSLAVRPFIEQIKPKGLIDVGSGAGFPGIPLAICYPNVLVILIEVNQKKVRFLEHVISILALTNVKVYNLDWRTFLRKTSYDIDLVCARASLPNDELLRMFKPSSPYHHAQLIYWASRIWRPTPEEKLFMNSEHTYIVGNKQRRLVFFKNIKKESCE